MLFPDNILLTNILNMNDESQFRLMIQVISIVLCFIFFYNNLNAHTENKNRTYYNSGKDTKKDHNNDDYSLTQNTPNPFSDSTYISYSLPEKTNVTLEIYNDRAELLEIMVNEIQEAGSYSILFYPEVDGMKLPAGVYYYKLKTTDTINSKKNEFVDVKKMIIIE